MAKPLLILLISSLLLFGSTTSQNKLLFGKPVGTCCGNSPCKACSNCSACKYCNNGGSCGICAKPKTNITNNLSSAKKTSTTSSVSIGQCKALTKKGRGVKEAVVVMAIVGNMDNKFWITDNRTTIEM
jgi:hypothetical protein